MEMPLKPKEMLTSQVDEVVADAIKETGDLYPVMRYLSESEVRALVVPLVT